MNAQPYQSVGLGGDGDGISAIREVEANFDVTLDYSDAPNWVTAGDVYRSLLKALPTEEAAKPNLWERFAEALSRETGVSPKSIGPESTLLAEPSRRVHFAIASARFWILTAITTLLAFGIGFLNH